MLINSQKRGKIGHQTKDPPKPQSEPEREVVKEVAIGNPIVIGIVKAQHEVKMGAKVETAKAGVGAGVEIEKADPRAEIVRVEAKAQSSSKKTRLT